MPHMRHIGLQYNHAGMGGLSDVRIHFRNLIVHAL